MRRKRFGVGLLMSVLAIGGLGEPALSAQHHHGATATRPTGEGDATTHQGRAADDADPSPESKRFADEMDAGMAKMMEDMHTPGYTGDADVDFLAMMIPHHQGAIEMARLVLIHGKDPLTRRVAEDILASQTAEVQAMQQRLAILRKGGDSAPGGFPALDGTRGIKEPKAQD